MGQADKLDLMSYELETKFYDHTHLGICSKILSLNRNYIPLKVNLLSLFWCPWAKAVEHYP